MAKPSDSPGFKELLREWNRKLGESGFKDIEYGSGDDLKIKESGSVGRYRDMTEECRRHKSDFFEVVKECIQETKFDTKFERVVLKLYSTGMTKVAIKEKLKIKGHRCKIYNPIYKYLRQWGLKY